MYSFFNRQAQDEHYDKHKEEFVDNHIIALFMRVWFAKYGTYDKRFDSDGYLELANYVVSNGVPLHYSEEPAYAIKVTTDYGEAWLFVGVRAKQYSTEIKTFHVKQNLNF